MRVLASVLVGATAASATATGVADNSGAPTVAGATPTARKAAERTAAVTRCLKDVMDFLNVNLASGAGQLDSTKFSVMAGVVPSPDPTFATNKVSDNLVGYMGGLCAKVGVGSTADSSGVEVATAADGTVPTWSSTVPADADIEACAGYHGSISDVNGPAASGTVAGTKISDVVMAQMFGTQTTGGEKGMFFDSVAAATAGTDPEADAILHDGATGAKGIVWGVDGTATGNGLADETAALLVIKAAANSPKSVTGAELQKLFSLQHSACQTAFLQESTMAGTVTAASAPAPFSVAALVAGTTLTGLENAVSRDLGFLNFGLLTRQLYSGYYKALAAPLTYAHFSHVAEANRLANTDTSGTEITAAALKEHVCMESLMKIYKANGAAGVVKTADGAPDTTKLIADNTLYDCISIDAQNGVDPCTRTGSAIGASTQQWGEWGSSAATNLWGVPLNEPQLLGSTIATLDFPEFTIAAGESSTYTNLACSAIKKATAAASSKRARENRCVLTTASLPDSMKALSPLFKDGAIMEITSTSATKAFQTSDIAADLGACASGDSAACAPLVTKLKADLTAGATVRIVGDLGTATGQVPHNHLQYKKATALDPGAAATCGVVRTEVAKILAARCDLPQALVNTVNAGSFGNAFAIGYGKRTHHVGTTDKTVAKSAVGWLPQLAGDCGFASSTPVVTTNNNSTSNSTGAATTSGAWSRFGAVVATATLAALAF